MNRHRKVPTSRHQLWGRTFHLSDEPVGLVLPYSFRAARALAVVTDAESESREAFLESSHGLTSERSRRH